MRLLKENLGPIIIAILLGVAMGIVFYSTKYFLRRLDGVLVEVSQERFMLEKKNPNMENAFVTEYAFNIEAAVLSFIVILIAGLFILKFRGANQRRKVATNKNNPKETNQNIRENIHPDSTFMG